MLPGLQPIPTVPVVMTSTRAPTPLPRTQWLRLTPTPPRTITEDTPFSLYNQRTLSMKGVIGSSSVLTSSCIFRSRIMKLAAQVSSSINSTRASMSRASTILAAWDVLPLAFGVQKRVVSLLKGRLSMKLEMSTDATALKARGGRCHPDSVFYRS